MDQIQIYESESKKVSTGVNITDIYGQRYIILDNVMLYITPDKPKEEII